MDAIAVEFTVKVPIKIVKRKNIYVVCCPMLDVHSQGKNRTEAIENIKDAVNLFLVSCFERGVLDKALKECGFISQPKPIPKLSLSSHTQTIDVPFYLINSGKVAERCQV